MTTTIQIKQHLDDGIYASLGGGETRVIAEWKYGPRNLVKAYKWLIRSRRDAESFYGKIGCGHTWLCTTDGRTLEERGVIDADFTDLESSLMTKEQEQSFERYMDRLNEVINPWPAQ